MIYESNWDSLSVHRVPQWYHDAKIGIFIHWGIYSVPAYAPVTYELGEVELKDNWFCNNPYAEWYYNSVNVKRGPSYEHHIKTYGEDFSYDDFIPLWKAESFDPGEWAKLFKEAGAGYVVLTTKHHDGFCLYDTKYTDYNSVKMGPKKDLTSALKKEVERAGMRMGLYYSGLIDWRFANAPILQESDNFSKASPTFEYADYAYKQSVELIDKYKPAVFWNDIGWPKQGEFNLPYLLSHYYNTVEDGVVNDRFNGLYKDFSTKEYKYGGYEVGEKWEMCRGLGLSFGYNQNESEDDIISSQKLIRLLVETVANDGNLLINVGPKADGTIPQEQKKVLLEMGNWLKVFGEGIYGTRPAGIDVKEKGEFKLLFTQKCDRIFMYLLRPDEKVSSFKISGIKRKLECMDPSLGCKVEYGEDSIEVRVDSEYYPYDCIGFELI